MASDTPFVIARQALDRRGAGQAQRDEAEVARIRSLLKKVDDFLENAAASSLGEAVGQKSDVAVDPGSSAGGLEPLLHYQGSRPSYRKSVNMESTIQEGEEALTLVTGGRMLNSDAGYNTASDSELAGEVNAGSA